MEVGQHVTRDVVAAAEVERTFRQLHLDARLLRSLELLRAERREVIDRLPDARVDVREGDLVVRPAGKLGPGEARSRSQIGRASCRDGGWRDVWRSGSLCTDV